MLSVPRDLTSATRIGGAFPGWPGLGQFCRARPWEGLLGVSRLTNITVIGAGCLGRIDGCTHGRRS